jgi:hypothetical protein
MITMQPYIHDYDSYHLVPQADRWMFNKLILAERLGYDCGPIGTKPSAQTDVIVRPCYNISGMGRGGFFEYDQWPFAAQANVPNANPGYFWCERFTGLHTYTCLVDDVVRYNSHNSAPYTYAVNQTWLGVEDPTLANAPAIPAFLNGISKYLYVEAIDGNIIEVAPRHSPMGVRQVIVDEYKLIDPSYVVPSDAEFGMFDMKIMPDIAGGLRWETVANSRRPFTIDQ